MKVKDFIQKNPVAIEPDRKVRDAVRLIFNLGVSSVLVKKNNKLLGIITEQDILHNLFPSLQDVLEDYAHARNFDSMESGLKDMLDKPVSEYMVKKVITTTPNTPLMKAQSTMLINRFSNLPVVDSDNRIKGIISQGDVFKALVSTEVPYDDDEEYHNWLSHHFDIVSLNLDRYDPEIESLHRLFRKHKVSAVVDLGCGTGSHAVGLANKQYVTNGLDTSRRMRKVARRKLVDASQVTRDNVQFPEVKDYGEYLSSDDQRYNAAIFMGNALAHMPDTYDKTVKALTKHVLEDQGLLIMQIGNIEKVIGVNGGLKSFSISASKFDKNRKYAFMEMYTDIPNDTKHKMLTMSVLEYNGRRWRNKSINSTLLEYLPKEKVQKLLKSLGYRNIWFYGSNFGEKMFEQEYNPKTHDWLNVITIK